MSFHCERDKINIGVCGNQQSLEDTLRVKTVHLHQLAPPNVPFYHTKAVIVKLSGDGNKNCM